MNVYEMKAIDLKKQYAKLEDQFWKLHLSGVSMENTEVNNLVQQMENIKVELTKVRR